MPTGMNIGVRQSCLCSFKRCSSAAIGSNDFKLEWRLGLHRALSSSKTCHSIPLDSGKKENLSQPKSYTILFASLVVLKRPFVTPRPFCRLSPSEMHGVNCFICLSGRSETRFPGKAFSGFSPRRLTRRKPQREHRTLKTATRPVRCVAGLTQNTHLSELRVRNFALVDEQYVHFHPGLNVITGQSGSGNPYC